MTRPVWLMLIVVAACAPRVTAPPAPGAGRPPVCRVGPDGGPIADRGIGGTGKPSAPVQASLQAEVQTADRGIGGTGIIGVVTGFASLCVAGEEVALPEGIPVRVDDHPATIDALRAGQVAATAAGGAANALRARAVEVMHVVIGPVDAVTAAVVTVAGQAVDVAGASFSAAAAKPGRWVAVSGLRQPGGLITATRVDPVPPGTVLVRGELVRTGGTARIGALPIRLPDTARLPGGWSVIVTGTLESGVLVADAVRLDVAGESPSAYFGPAISSYVVESYVTVAPGGYLVERDFVAGTGLGIIGSSSRRIVIYERGADGRLSAPVRDLGSGTENRGSTDFLPAPLPGGSAPPGGGQDDDSRPGPKPGPPHR